MKETDIGRMAVLASGSAYNEERKREYQLTGRRVLKALAVALGLAPGQYDIRWNPGGIGVSGDHRLHADRLYVAMGDNCGMGGFYYRSCKGRKDYTGGQNRWVTWTKFATIGIGGLAAQINKEMSCGHW